MIVLQLALATSTKSSKKLFNFGSLSLKCTINVKKGLLFGEDQQSNATFTFLMTSYNKIHVVTVYIGCRCH